VRSSGGFLLLLLGALGLIGFLSGNLDRWLGYLFSPPDGGEPATVATAVAKPPADRRIA
jgi:hypothetical protein